MNLITSCILSTAMELWVARRREEEELATHSYRHDKGGKKVVVLTVSEVKFYVAEDMIKDD